MLRDSFPWSHLSETIEILLLQYIDKVLGLVETVQKLWEFRSWHLSLGLDFLGPCAQAHGQG